MHSVGREQGFATAPKDSRYVYPAVFFVTCLQFFGRSVGRFSLYYCAISTRAELTFDVVLRGEEVFSIAHLYSYAIPPRRFYFRYEADMYVRGYGAPRPGARKFTRPKSLRE